MVSLLLGPNNALPFFQDGQRARGDEVRSEGWQKLLCQLAEGRVLPI
jgi:hypothetical protein